MAKMAPSIELLARLQRQAGAIPQNAVLRELDKVQASLRAEPRSAPHLFLVGLLQVRAAEYDAAIISLKKSLKLAGNSQAILGALAFIYAEKADNHGEALKYLRKKFTLDKTDSRTLMMMARSHLEIGEPDKAIEMLERAAPLVTDKAKIHALKAQCCLRMGDSAGARENYAAVTRLNPAAAFAMADKIAVLPDNSKEDLRGLKAQLEKFLLETPQVFRTEEHRAASWFALGEICEKLENHEEAFRHFQKGNDCQPRDRNLGSISREFEILRAVFTSGFFAKHNPAGHASRQQVFIVGMPRSGTTLIESILAGHPKIHDFGELDYFIRQIHFLGITKPSNDPVSQTIAAVKNNLENAPAQGFHDLGEQYIRHYGFPGFQGMMKIDKMPQNFMALGLIALIFPHAKIIHASRHPVDCCLSIFKNPLQGYHTGYANQLESLGEYYLEYLAQMKRWQEDLPLDIHEVIYEELVANTEPNARAMIGFLELEWDAACLEHTKSKRDVKTASAMQVRQEIYSTSVEKWRLYEAQLKPLTTILAEPIAEYEARLQKMASKSD